MRKSEEREGGPQHEKGESALCVCVRVRVLVLGAGTLEEERCVLCVQRISSKRKRRTGGVSRRGTGGDCSGYARANQAMGKKRLR